MKLLSFSCKRFRYVYLGDTPLVRMFFAPCKHVLNASRKEIEFRQCTPFLMVSCCFRIHLASDLVKVVLSED